VPKDWLSLKLKNATVNDSSIYQFKKRLSIEELNVLIDILSFFGYDK
jgi:hypothetical protein